MNLMSFKCLLFCFVLTTVCCCTKPVDFNQAKDLMLDPVIESSLIFYNAKAGDFFIGGSEENTVSDFAEIGIFSDGFVRDNLIKAEFVFETKNSINRPYELTVNFEDNSNNILETFTIETPAAVNNELIENVHIETFEGNSLNNLKQSQILRFTLRMLSGEEISEGSLGEIDLKSKGVFYLNLDI